MNATRHEIKKKGSENMEDLLKEQQRTNELLEKLISQDKDPNELLTIEQIHEEFDIRN